MTDDVPASQRWRGRPVHSLLIQVFVFAVPIVASVLATTAASSIGPTPDSVAEFVAWWAVLTGIALVVLLVVDRLARRLLPLAALLKLSMLFPDRAPSRFRIARNAASVRKLQEQLAEARERGVAAEPVWAAESVLTLITALGHHDRRSRGHSERVHIYAELLAEELDLDQADRDRLRWAALLHDVGKLVVPAELLNKPSQPDDEEWHALRTHPQAGAELCAPLLPWLGEWGLAIAEHHEWYDGTGYPQGLSGHEISRAARIVAVADCYEVMTTARTYKRALNPAAAREELARCAGTQFDPAIVRAFLNVSLGRLRLAMGPLALLSTVPSMARLSAFFEPLARAGAVIGGAALIVGGSSVLPSDATMEPRPPAVEAPVPADAPDMKPVAQMTPKDTADRAVAAAATAGADAGRAASGSTPAGTSAAQPEPRDRAGDDRDRTGAGGDRSGGDGDRNSGTGSHEEDEPAGAGKPGDRNGRGGEDGDTAAAPAAPLPSPPRGNGGDKPGKPEKPGRPASPADDADDTNTGGNAGGDPYPCAGNPNGHGNDPCDRGEDTPPKPRNRPDRADEPVGANRDDNRDRGRRDRDRRDRDRRG